MKKRILILVFILSYIINFSQTQEEIKTIIKDYDVEYINSLSVKFNNKYKEKKEYALKMAKINNWPIIIRTEKSLSELMEVVDGKPIYIGTKNIDAAESTRANTLHNNGLLGLNIEGQNMTAYVWDGGIARVSHQEYDGVGGNNRYSIGDVAASLNSHAAHVTGTIMASGFQSHAKGMAPQCNVIGFEWNNDISEVTTQTNNGMLISNHSYGALPDAIPDQNFGAYTQYSRNWDIIMFNAPYYLMVAAAGNEGLNNTSNASPLDNNINYDKLSRKECSKNNLTVANAQDATIDSNGDLIAVSINIGSSQGPTDDYRIKPDIAGNGTQLYSTWDDADDSYQSISGTSMASPNVTGTLLLLQQYYNELNGNFMKAATLKGLALHTADDAGTIGPDSKFGWGLLNAKKAAKTIERNNIETKIEEITLNTNQFHTTTVVSDGINPLIASISWTDPAGVVNNDLNSSVPALVNDLDIRITKDGTTFYPHKLTSITTNGLGDNTVDPFERIDIENAAGSYSITVNHKSSLTNGFQNFSLIITGIEYSGTCTPDDPINTNTTFIISGDTTLSWNEVIGATYEIRYKAENSNTWNYVASTDLSVELTGLTESSYNAQVRSICDDNGTISYSNWVDFDNAPQFVLKTKDHIFDNYIKTYTDNNNLNIIATNNYTISKISIYNVLGKQLYNRNQNGNDISINKSIFGSEKILIIKIELSDGSVGFKKLLLQ